MRSVKIKNDINDINNKTCCLKFLDIIELLIEFDIKNLKYYIRVFASLFRYGKIYRKKFNKHT